MSLYENFRYIGCYSRYVHSHYMYEFSYYITDDFGNSYELSMEEDDFIINFYLVPYEEKADFYLYDTDYYEEYYYSRYD